MREIEFRGRDKRHDGTWEPWVYGSLDLSDLGPVIYSGITPPENVEPETIGQWTGLLDKGFHRIYEGDVVKAEYEYGHKEIVGVVQYYTEWACYGVLDEHGEGQSWEHLIGLCTIIGNIFDDEELMQKYGRAYFGKGRKTNK